LTTVHTAPWLSVIDAAGGMAVPSGEPVAPELDDPLFDDPVFVLPDDPDVEPLAPDDVTLV
jgi:hypothetical protein